MRLQKILPRLGLWKTPRRMNMMDIISAWLNIELFKVSLKTRKTILVSRVNENVPFINCKKIIVDDPIANVVNGYARNIVI